MEFKLRRVCLAALITFSLVGFTGANAAVTVKFFDPEQANAGVPLEKINQIVTHYFNTGDFNTGEYREIKVQVITNLQHQPDHLLIYLFSKRFHRVDIARVNLDSRYDAASITRNYKLSDEDFAQQPGVSPQLAKCPDPSVEFIAFCPNNDKLELDITKKVAKAARTHGLKTVTLLKKKATSKNYLNYMKCPKLKGNFYDGDADPELITTYDGTISATAIKSTLNNQFAYKVTNIWLACEAYNDPMKSAMLVTAQSQKYAAGINNLVVGPSDQAAACTMEAALDGKPMTDAFQACYEKYDTPDDQWGFSGDGSDIFGS